MSSRTIIFSWALILTFSIPVFGDGVETKEFTYNVRSDKRLEVTLDVDVGEVNVMPSDVSGECQVRLTYCPEGFEAKVDYREKSNDLKIHLDKKSWSSKWDDDCGETIIAEVSLPVDVDMTLETKVKAGEVILDLSGLRLKVFRLRVWAGEVGVHFDEPNPVEMDYMIINTSIGELSTSQLGNARFKKASINGGIGEINIDLTGALLDESRAIIDLDIGEVDITLPGDYGIRLSVGGTLGFLSQKDIDPVFVKRGSNYYTEDFKENEKRISVRVTSGLGEVVVNRE